MLSKLTARAEQEFGGEGVLGVRKTEFQAKRGEHGSSHCGSAVMNLTSNHEDLGSIPSLDQWVKDYALL